MTPLTSESKFQAYVGRPVKVEHRVEEKNFTFLGMMKFDIYEPDPEDPVLREIRQVCELDKRDFRLWLPDTVGTTDMKESRLNVVVTRALDGSFSIANIYFG